MDSLSAANTHSITHRTGDMKGRFNVPVKEQDEEPKQDKSSTLPLDSVVALTTAMSAYSGSIKPGETVTISMGKDQVASITKEGLTNWDRMGMAAKEVGSKAVAFTSEAIEQDPSFMFRQAVETVKRPLSNNAPQVIQDLAITKGLYPGIRAGVLYLDIRKAWKTLKDPNSTRMDKIIDVGHVLTDIGGVVGAVAPLVGLAFPGVNVLAAGAIVGDIISFGYHAIRHVQNKHTEIRKKKALEEAAKKEQEKQKGQVDQGKKPQQVDEPQDTKKSSKS